jgi:hypothetical protein
LKYREGLPHPAYCRKEVFDDQTFGCTGRP